MKRRLLGGLGVVVAGAFAAVPLHAAAGLPLPTPSLSNSAVTGSSPSLCAPAVTGVASHDAAGNSFQYGPAGSTITVSGANFQQPGCSLQDVKVGTASVAKDQVTIASNSSLSFKLPPSASGPVSVAEQDVFGNAATSNGNFVFIETPTGTVLSPNPVEGTPVTVLGSGYQPFTANQAGSVKGAVIQAGYNGCGSALVVGASAQNDSTLALPGPSRYCDGPLSVTFYAPQDTSRPLDCNGGSPTYNCIPVAIGVGNIDVFFFVSSLSPPAFSSVHPGNVIQLQGSGFGTSGRADLSGTEAAVSWSDHTIAVTVPRGAQTGVLTVQRATGDLQAFQIGSYLVPGTPGSLGGPGTPGSNGGGTIPGVSGGPTIGPNGVPRYGVPPFHAGGRHGGTPPSGSRTARDALSLSFDATQTASGGDVPFVVSLTLNNKPVSGAPVRLTILAAPGSDARLRPSSGVTDSSGSFRGVLHLSRNPGDHLVLATSGIYSDEAHVLGQPFVAGSHSGTGPLSAFGFGTNGNPVVLWLAVATTVLVLFGVLVNIDVLRRFIWAITIGALLRRRRNARKAAKAAAG